MRISLVALKGRDPFGGMPSRDTIKRVRFPRQAAFAFSVRKIQGDGDFAMLLKSLGQLLALVIAFCIIWLSCFGWEIDKASVMGHTVAEVREQYGEPDVILDYRKAGGTGYQWRYFRGLLGQDRITFDQNDVVIEVDGGAGPT